MIKLKVLIISCLCLATSVLSATEKHALVIAIGNYPEAGGWSTISSLNDVAHVLSSLDYLGFEKERITTLLDDQGTKQNIINTFATLQSQVGEGDIIYIHFSGHGQQAADDNGDELDGLDECIVPYDSPLEYSASYKGEKLIRDDQLNILIGGLREKCGASGQVVLILDSCHSGTGFRGIGRTRGTDKIMAPANFKKKPVKASSTPYLESGNQDDLAPLVGFFGSSAKELNFETTDEQNKPVGSLTYSLAQVLGSLKADLSFVQLFNLVKLKMKKFAPRQHPQVEGPVNLQFLNSSIELQPDYFEVSNIVSPKEIIASCGSLNGIYQETKVSVINSLTKEVICSGVVNSTSLNTAKIRLDSPLDNENTIAYGILIKEYAIAPVTIGIRSLSPTNPQWSDLYSQLSNLSFLVENSINPDVFLEENEDGNLSLRNKYDNELVSIGTNNEKKASFNKLKLALINQVQGNFLRSYQSRNPRIDLAMEIITVDPDTEEELAILNPEKANLSIGQCIKFKVINEGIIGTYVSLMDVQPDNEVNVILPALQLGYKAEEYYLKPGESLVTNFIIEIAEPLGEETLLLLGSREPQDLSGILMSKGRSQRGTENMDPFEHLLQSTYGRVNTRGTKFRSKKKNKLSTRTYHFTIGKK